MMKAGHGRRGQKPIPWLPSSESETTIKHVFRLKITNPNVTLNIILFLLLNVFSICQHVFLAPFQHLPGSEADMKSNKSTRQIVPHLLNTRSTSQQN